MRTKRKLLQDRAFGLLIFIGVLQAVAVGLILRYGGDILERNRSIEEHTSTMVKEVFPTMRSDLVDVSQKTSDIKTEVAGLRNQMAVVDEHLNEVHQGVRGVGSSMEGLNRNVQEFVQDRTGLIWGHSLNPYVLTGLLAIIVVSVPLCTWRFYRNRPESPAASEISDANLGFSDKLDRLSEIMETIRSGDTSCSAGPELRHLMEKTERLIDEARMELTMLSEREKTSCHDRGGSNILH
ncbi:MAG TPA: hypothetical protein VK463_10535 [Desulfomonilaceae bacterium]|nr:hypothetical protein [Desulfomonilaceae bacterium]